MDSEDRYRKPVEVGDVIEVTIESTGAKGDGIAKVNNFVVIIPGAKEGQKVKVKITRVLKKMAFAEIAGESSGEDDNESRKEDEHDAEDEEHEESEDEFGDESEEEES
ncbi:TRAM domain-containing protein [Candidatus Woesearchaeota archaeon]|nr:TRAM domain-containing protein [Candidatus Woesearchaeota archaeon]